MSWFNSQCWLDRFRPSVLWGEDDEIPGRDQDTELAGEEVPPRNQLLLAHHCGTRQGGWLTHSPRLCFQMSRWRRTSVSLWVPGHPGGVWEVSTWAWHLLSFWLRGVLQRWGEGRFPPDWQILRRSGSTVRHLIPHTVHSNSHAPSYMEIFYLFLVQTHNYQREWAAGPVCVWPQRDFGWIPRLLHQRPPWISASNWQLRSRYKNHSSSTCSQTGWARTPCLHSPATRPHHH